ncbi:MAG: orotate phosphoribosyltransferase [Dehalococcoidales bacterium]|jgi:orotate phosphoribosyltransferase|nr:orotate phosphoribosyltransferase [Dehalococcoidales bacterium]MDP6738270.1 orotate phosphoribosyltransferase [Dehalococcoidales bacterium]|tara:strand:+ start:7996 stop:8631 length:636 start_codon:yes stop_codon:yes gene_type:complete
MNNVEEIFEQAGTILKGHFRLTSGRHSPVYWEKFQVLQFPKYTEELCQMIANHFRYQNIQLVAGPTTGGIILAFEVARQLGVRGIFAEKESGQGFGQKARPGGRVFRRGFNINPGDRVLIVDDILTTGSSVREVITAITNRGGLVVGVGVMVDRSELQQGEIDLRQRLSKEAGLSVGVPLFSCLRSLTPTYEPENCPLCAECIPLVKPGGG